MNGLLGYAAEDLPLLPVFADINFALYDGILYDC
jgi:hypothetical protein